MTWLWPHHWSIEKLSFEPGTLAAEPRLLVTFTLPLRWVYPEEHFGVPGIPSHAFTYTLTLPPLRLGVRDFSLPQTSIVHSLSGTFHCIPSLDPHPGLLAPSHSQPPWFQLPTLVGLVPSTTPPAPLLWIICICPWGIFTSFAQSHSPSQHPGSSSTASMSGIPTRFLLAPGTRTGQSVQPPSQGPIPGSFTRRTCSWQLPGTGWGYCGERKKDFFTLVWLEFDRAWHQLS